jgi:hypothetical protein
MSSHSSAADSSDSVESAVLSFVNEEKHGVYTYDDIALRFSSSADYQGYISALRRLVDAGRIPSPRE